MPLFKTGHQPKTHMDIETGFVILAKDRLRYEQSVNSPPDMAEKMVRAVIAAWASKEQPDVRLDWMYVWNTGTGPWPTSAAAPVAKKTE